MKHTLWLALMVSSLAALGSSIAFAAPPLVTLTVTQSAVGGPYNASWTATGAIGCTGTSSPGNGAWDGAKALSGSAAVAGVAAGNVLSLSCSTAGDLNAALTWTAPTLNTDGTALTNLKDYIIYTSPQGGTLIPLAAALVNGPASILWPATTYTITGLPVGVRDFAMTARNTANVESVQTGRVSKTLTAPETTVRAATAVAVVQPNPPTGLTIAVVSAANVTPAYKILADGTRSTVLAGFVPVGRNCFAAGVFTYRGKTFKRVAQGDVQWWATVATDAVAAPCS